MAVTVFHAAGCLALERTQRTLLMVMTAPISIRRLVFEFAWGTIWRYRWLLLMVGMMISFALIQNQPAYLLWFPLIFFSQMACYLMLAMMVSMLVQSAFQARLIMGIFLLALVVVIPSLLSHWTLVVKPLIMPYAFWEALADMLKSFEWRIQWVLILICVQLWMITAWLFFMTCLLVRRWAQRV